jgi:two-component system, OmpR family, response regulator RegX3
VIPSSNTPAAPNESKPDSKPTVLVVEDEDSYVDALTVGLDREGFEVLVARDGRAGLDLFHERSPDFVLLDVMLPGLSGIDVCRSIRGSGSPVPIIMVSARTGELDVVLGLELGADDYVSKPYRIRELVARIRAVQRRRELAIVPAVGVSTVDTSESEDVIEVGAVRLDQERHEITVRGEVVIVPLKEFELLGLLMERAGRVVTRESAISNVWGDDYVGDTKTLDVHINRLRNRIEENPSEPKFIVTVRGVGYRYEKQ